MSRPLAWLLWSTTMLSTVTGLAYVGMRELMTRDDPFSAYNHPLQPWALVAHLLIVPLLVLLLGWAWGVHAAPRLADRSRAARLSGLANIGLGLLMIGSGYLLQVVSSDSVRLALAWTHGIAGSLFALAFVAHVVAGVRSRRINGMRVDLPAARRGIRLRAGQPVALTGSVPPVPRDPVRRREEASGAR